MDRIEVVTTIGRIETAGAAGIGHRLADTSYVDSKKWSLTIGFDHRSQPGIALQFSVTRSVRNIQPRFIASTWRTRDVRLSRQHRTQGKHVRPRFDGVGRGMSQRVLAIPHGSQMRKSGAVSGLDRGIRKTLRTAFNKRSPLTSPRCLRSSSAFLAVN